MPCFEYENRFLKGGSCFDEDQRKRCCFSESACLCRGGNSGAGRRPSFPDAGQQFPPIGGNRAEVRLCPVAAGIHADRLFLHFFESREDSPELWRDHLPYGRRYSHFAVFHLDDRLCLIQKGCEIQESDGILPVLHHAFQRGACSVLSACRQFPPSEKFFPHPAVVRYVQCHVHLHHPNVHCQQPAGFHFRVRQAGWRE